MATSTIAAQFSLQCQLCEGEPNIKFRCLECNLLMCTKCKDKIHPKFKNANEHQVLDIRKLSQHTTDIQGDTTIDHSPGDRIIDHSPGDRIIDHSPGDRTTTPIIKANLSTPKTYQTTLTCVDYLSVSLDDFLWIGENKKKKIFRLPSSRALQKVRLEGNKAKIISSFNVEAINICVTPSNDLLVATGRPILQTVSESSDRLSDSVYQVDGLRPVSVHVTREHQVIVGAFSTRNEKGIVIIMDKDGNHLTKYEKDNHGKDIFPNSAPDNIASTSNGNIFVAIFPIFDTNHRVLTLNEGNIINTYTGDSLINAKKYPFRAMDIKATPSDNVIVSDTTNHMLHILNNTGSLLQCNYTKAIGIEYPFSLAVTTAGHFNILYVGCDTEVPKKRQKYLN